MCPAGFAARCDEDSKNHFFGSCQHWLCRDFQFRRWQILNYQADKKLAVKNMSRSHKLVFLFLAVSILSISALAQSDYTVNLTANKFLGSYLANQSGFALYYFSDDSSASGSSTCYDECASNWPPFYAQTIIVPDSLKSVDFAAITRTDGSKQTTFRGWPLYLSSRDKAAGDVFGNGMEDNRWHVVDPQDQPQLF
jgi:predicted lipoprotein with Yx(FWY)xxD motif